MFFNRKKKKLNRLLEYAIKFGLREIDSNAVIDFLNNKEYGLAFDTIVSQLYEFDNEISQTFYIEVKKVAELLNVEKIEYDFLKRNIKEMKSKPPIAVKDKIVEICNDLKANSDL